MSVEDALHQIMKREHGRGGADPTAETDTTDDLGSFGWLRGARERAPMLELRKRTGDILAIAYGWLERVEFSPSEGITLHHAGRKIALQGRNLNMEIRPQVRLFEGIVRHKIAWIQESGAQLSCLKAGGSTLVEQISW